MSSDTAAGREVEVNPSVGPTQINVHRCVCRNLLRCLLDAVRASNVNTLGKFPVVNVKLDQ